MVTKASRDSGGVRKFVVENDDGETRNILGARSNDGGPFGMRAPYFGQRSDDGTRLRFRIETGSGDETRVVSKTVRIGSKIHGNLGHRVLVLADLHGFQERGRGKVKAAARVENG